MSSLNDAFFCRWWCNVPKINTLKVISGEILLCTCDHSLGSVPYKNCPRYGNVKHLLYNPKTQII